jgi:hypothetical protein
MANLKAEQDAKPKMISQPHSFDDSTESAVKALDKQEPTVMALPPNDADFKTSNDPTDEPQVSSVSFSTLSIMTTLAGETSASSLSSKSR